jgi:hypothetical protein
LLFLLLQCEPHHIHSGNNSSKLTKGKNIFRELVYFSTPRIGSALVAKQSGYAMAETKNPEPAADGAHPWRIQRTRQDLDHGRNT